MISSVNRFHGYGSLNYLFRKGQTVRGQIISLRFTPNQKRKESRVAVIVARKVAKNSPERNRIRRRVYEIFRQSKPHIRQNIDLAFIVYDSVVATMPSEELKKTIIGILKKADLIV